MKLWHYYAYAIFYFLMGCIFMYSILNIMETIK